MNGDSPFDGRHDVIPCQAKPLYDIEKMADAIMGLLERVEKLEKLAGLEKFKAPRADEKNMGSPE